MYDQSFSPMTLGRLLRRSDFRDYPLLAIDAYKSTQIASASNLAYDLFGGASPLTSFQKNGKPIFRVNSFPAELVTRKITRNVRRLGVGRMPDRQIIVGQLKRLISEGTPFRIYRLDIKSFYESFDTGDVLNTVEGLVDISPQTKRITGALLHHFSATGATGVPRGLALSSVLSELMMRPFDKLVANAPSVYFYGRYVDDIIVVTGGAEKQGAFLKFLRRSLPPGLTLNETKQRIVSANERVAPSKTGGPLLSFSYLGYNFRVNEPIRANNMTPSNHFRDVEIDISPAKIQRYKTRICRAFIDFARTSNFDLLHERMKFLTHNFSIRDYDTGIKRMAGIHYNYPHITQSTSSGLEELDKFLRDAARSNHGRIFSRTAPLLTKEGTRKLLALSFSRGHAKRSFIHLHPTRIKVIQECWAHD